MLALIALHALVAVVAPVVFRRIGRRVFWFCAIAPAATLAWAATKASAVVDGRVVTESLPWVPQLDLELSFRLDAFALLMVALISGIGVLIFWYSSSYFAGREQAKLGVFAAQLTVFAGAMFGLVTADNVFGLFIFWELTAVTSYLLIGFDDTKGSTRAAARQALLITSMGGLALLGGLILLSQAAGTASLHEILADPPTGGVVPAALVLVVLGAATKSAQLPFHSWLPAAMVAPTPVSAYLHSATMVKAGIYLVARFAPAFAGEPPWRPLVISIGLATMFAGALRALRQHDLKLLLAYGTISQLGFLFVLFGSGVPGATEAGAALLLAHALFKSALFLTVGVIDHQAHTRDVRALDGIGRLLPGLCIAAIVAAASMAGIPLFFGFVAKELAYESFLQPGLGPVADVVVLVGIVTASMLTVAYSGRFVWGAFAKKDPNPGAPAVESTIERPARSFVAPVAILATITLILGVLPALADPLVVAGAQALDPAVGSKGLALWHGWSSALALTALTLGVGVLLVVKRRRVERIQEAAPSPIRSDAAYRRTLELLNRLADRVTGTLQNGSLPTYLGVIAVTVLALPGVALAVGSPWPDDTRFAESPLQVVVVALVVVVAVAATAVRRRFVVVILLGSVGYSVAALFVIQGGPDLALTLLLVETLSVVIFVLVLRHMPERFADRPWREAGLGRAAIAVGMGVFVTAFTIVAAGSRTATPVAEGLSERALPDGDGRNVVNVILTDFRALDTLGEIAVLTLAALGIISLLMTRQRRQAARDATSERAR
ncbi:MAG: hydrogen gas-evolving membrane-bound hydrogenase subunit E [Acidimicrobiia bacterium]